MASDPGPQPAPAKPRPSWAEYALQAFKAWRGGDGGPLWARLLTWAPILLLISWILYSWNKQARQLQGAKNELDAIKAEKEQLAYRARTTAVEAERPALEDRVTKLSQVVDRREQEIKALEQEHAERSTQIQGIRDWNQVDAAW